MIVWTYAVSGVLYACVLFCLFLCCCCSGGGGLFVCCCFLHLFSANERVSRGKVL